jgi:hypothetical protein
LLQCQTITIAPAIGAHAFELSRIDSMNVGAVPA